MAENNRNKNRSLYASDENWDNPQDRYSQRNDYYQSRYQNENFNREREVDFNKNRQYGNNSGWNESYNRNKEYDRQEDRYGNEAGRYGNTERYYQNQGWKRREGQGGLYGSQNRDEDMGSSYRSGYSGNYGYEDPYENSGNNWRNQRSNYGNAGKWNAGYDPESRYRESNREVNFNRQGNQDRLTSRYGGDTSNYGNANQGGVDRGWWDKTRDEVSSWFGDDDAERRRQRDRQESGPHRGKGPKGYRRSDERIREDVCDRLSDHPMIDASEIDIRVEGTEVILSGTVDSKEDKRRAEDIAESISGVTNVQNQLKVNPRNWSDDRER